MKKLPSFIMLLKGMVVLCLVLLTSCRSDTKTVSVPHQFSFNREEMPRPGKPDFFEGDICMAEYWEEKGGERHPSYITIERKEDSVIIFTPWGMGGNRSFYDANGFLLYRSYGSCLRSYEDSISYKYDKTSRLLYQFECHAERPLQEWRHNYKADTVFYLFDDRNRLQSKTARNDRKNQIRITSFYYNKGGLKVREFTRVYNNNLLEVEDSNDFERELKLYYYTGQKLDSSVTMKSEYYASDNIAWKMKTLYRDGTPDSVFRNDKFCYRYRLYRCAEFRDILKKMR